MQIGDRVVLKTDLGNSSCLRGDIATVVEINPASIFPYSIHVDTDHSGWCPWPVKHGEVERITADA